MILESLSELTPVASVLNGPQFLSLFLSLSLIILFAAIIRGCAGFGFSAIVVAAESLFLPTREVVPLVLVLVLVLLLEVVASLQMAKQDVRETVELEDGAVVQQCC